MRKTEATEAPPKSASQQMPGKKKKGKKKGGKGDAGDGGLPPPPDFSQNRQGALEALLSFKIQSKQELIELYSEEAENYKDRIYQQRHKNYAITREKARHLNGLIQEALEFEKKLCQSETVGREDVEKAMLIKLEWTKVATEDIMKLEIAIQEEECQLLKAYEELARLKKYKNEMHHEREEYIDYMKQTMKNWENIEEQLGMKLSDDIMLAKQKVDQKLASLAEIQKEKISERLLHTMDSDAKGEIADNLWLKQQIKLLEGFERKLQHDVDTLELRNLEVMEAMYNSQHRELMVAQRIVSVPEHHLSPIGSTEKKIVSRQLDVGLLSIEGTQFPLKPTPEHIHLPPIEEQRNHVIPRLNWPVTGKMLKAIS